MIGLGAGTPSNRLRRQASYNIYDKSTKSGTGGYDSSTGGGKSYDSSSSGSNYGSSSSDNSYGSSSSGGGGNGYDSGGANYGDIPPTVVSEQYNNPYSVNSREGNLFVLTENFHN